MESDLLAELLDDGRGHFERAESYLASIIEDARKTAGMAVRFGFDPVSLVHTRGRMFVLRLEGSTCSVSEFTGREEEARPGRRGIAETVTIDAGGAAVTGMQVYSALMEMVGRGVLEG